MTVLADLISDVYTITNRPDLVSETSLAVRTATLKLHQTDYFPKDLREEGLVFDTSQRIQSLEYRTIFPRFRAIKYFRRTDSAGTPSGPDFSVLEADNMLDGYGTYKEDILYLAGEYLRIRSSAEFKYAMIGIYQNPDVAVASFSSWIASDHPFAIVYEAAMQIVSMIGLKEDAAMLKLARDEQVALLRMSNIQMEGY